jgi:oxalate decarboxylase/phosphoglucose isomerase-like protein (cupin superfamily)
MTENRKYTEAVAAGHVTEGGAVPLDDRFVNENGEILNVLFGKFQSVARLGSKRGAVRANHWHRTDDHYALVEYGRVLYFERAVGATEVPEPAAFGPGQMFYTPPGREHAMLFTEDTVIYTFAKNVRTHDEHEADLVRVPFVTQEIARRFLP